jgi:rhamnosyltransferase
MNTSDILAVVVSYNGMMKTVQTVQALRGSAGKIVIVDNGSEEPSLNILRELARDGISVIFLSENMGIAYALNLGVAEARRQGYSWLLTMDQDSKVEPTMINKYIDAITEMPDEVCLTPCIKLNGKPTVAFSGLVQYAITSGNLVKTEIFSKIGLYNEDMFIDAVDFDFSLRVRRSGWNILRVAGAYMHHELGEQHSVTGPFSRFYTRHSPIRRYYAYRNWLYLAKNYIHDFPLFTAKFAFAHLMLFITMIFYDRNPTQSLAYAMRGIRDFFYGRSGRYTKEK